MFMRKDNCTNTPLDKPIWPMNHIEYGIPKWLYGCESVITQKWKRQLLPVVPRTTESAAIQVYLWFPQLVYWVCTTHASRKALVHFEYTCAVPGSYLYTCTADARWSCTPSLNREWAQRVHFTILLQYFTWNSGLSACMFMVRTF